MYQPTDAVADIFKRVLDELEANLSGYEPDVIASVAESEAVDSTVTQENVEPMVRQNVLKSRLIRTASLLVGPIRRKYDELVYEIRRPNEIKSAKRYANETNQLRQFQRVLETRTPFQVTIDAVIRERFGIPEIENEEANNAAMHHYLMRYIAEHCPRMRKVDVALHIEGAITRAYVPTQLDSLNSAIRRSTTYQVLNRNFHGEEDLQQQIDKRTRSKFRRIVQLFTGRQVDHMKVDHELDTFKQHSIQHASVNINHGVDHELPETFGQMDPFHRPKESNTNDSTEDQQEQKQKDLKPTKRSKTSKKKKVNNVEPGGSVTTLTQC